MKEMVVKQTVEVNPADEHPGVSEVFFFSDCTKQTEVDNLPSSLAMFYEGHSLPVTLAQIL